MKTKLLKRLRRRGRNQINIYSVTTEGNTVIGMKIGYNDDAYGDLFDFGDTKEEVLKKAENIYLQDNIDAIKKRYKNKICCK